jgi:predicted ester cyclase
MIFSPGQNKLVVQTFNKEVIEEGNLAKLQLLIDDQFVNHHASPIIDSGPSGMLYTINRIVRPALTDFRLHILEQIEEGDLIATRKVVTGTHTGQIMGIKPTGKSVAIEVLEIVRIRDGKYAEYWGLNNLMEVLTHLGRQQPPEN